MILSKYHLHDTYIDTVMVWNLATPSRSPAQEGTSRVQTYLKLANEHLV